MYVCMYVCMRVCMQVPEPEFEGQTKTRLGNPEVRQAVDAVVGEKLLTFFEWNPQAYSEYIHTYIKIVKSIHSICTCILNFNFTDNRNIVLPCIHTYIHGTV